MCIFSKDGYVLPCFRPGSQVCPLRVGNGFKKIFFTLCGSNSVFALGDSKCILALQSSESVVPLG